MIDFSHSSAQPKLWRRSTGHMDLLKPSSTLLEARSRLAASLRLTTTAAISRDAARKIRQALSRSPKARSQVATVLRGLRLLQLPKPSSRLQSSIQPLRLPLHAKLHAMLRLGDLEGTRLSLQNMMKDGYRVISHQLQSPSQHLPTAPTRTRTAYTSSGTSRGGSHQK